MREEFPKPVVEILAKRVGNRCSNPACCKRTSGPHSDDNKALNVGVAAHVTAASVGGPRYDSAIQSEDRKGIGNGIWLCQSCAKLVDNDETRYTKELLLEWKQDAEQDALREIESAVGATGPSDVAALKEYCAQFDRAALQDALRNCGSYRKFAETLGDLISLLNTGTIQGQTLTKRRTNFDCDVWRRSLEDLYHEVRGLRGFYTELVRSGEINEEKCTCGFRNHSKYDDFETMKQAIIDRLNAILMDAHLPTIRGVFG